MWTLQGDVATSLHVRTGRERLGFERTLKLTAESIKASSAYAYDTQAVSCDRVKRAGLKPSVIRTSLLYHIPRCWYVAADRAKCCRLRQIAV
jgi:hypothetical protein